MTFEIIALEEREGCFFDKNKKTAVLVIALLIGLLIVSGCNALRKPAPENRPESQVPAPAVPSREPMPTSPEEVDRIATELARVAGQVSGVNGLPWLYRVRRHTWALTRKQAWRVKKRNGSNGTSAMQ